ncbi:hypothetical protein [Fluviicola sp.]|uniref:hypothetical protein n=1 Tax=Fluviicola sp. TaxID=1917219 RepID=UPI003D2A7DF3
MAVSICAFNSTELTNQELIDDGLNLFVDWELSDMFSDLLLSRDIATGEEPGELDQIARVVNVDVETIYQMSNYWDREQEVEHLSRLNSETDKAKQLEIIQKNNNSLVGNIEKVDETIRMLEIGILRTDNLETLLTKSNAEYYNNNLYFSTENKPYQSSLLNDIIKIKEFIEFVKPLDADTVYFKFKTVY